MHALTRDWPAVPPEKSGRHTHSNHLGTPSGPGEPFSNAPAPSKRKASDRGPTRGP